MSITERFELKLQEKLQEADRKKVYNAVRLCFKFQIGKEQAYATILEEDPDISPELLKSTIQEIYGE